MTVDITDDQVRQVFEQNQGRMLTADDVLKSLGREDVDGYKRVLHLLSILVRRRFIFPKYREGKHGYVRL